MASGASRLVRGSYTGTGVAFNVKTPAKPCRVDFFNVTDPATGHHLDTMPAASILVATDTFVWVTSDGITLASQEEGDSFTGFTVGTDANFNTAAERVHWTAWYVF